MKNKLVPLVLTFALTSISSFGAPKISGSLKILSPATNEEVSTVRIGQQIKLRVAVKNLNLIANKDIKFTYAISVIPKGSDTPVTISGKITGPFTLPASEGGAKSTREEMADWAGLQVGTELITIPDILPEGKATLSVSLNGDNVGSINFNKSLKIQL